MFCLRKKVAVVAGDPSILGASCKGAAGDVPNVDELLKRTYEASITIGPIHDYNDLAAHLRAVREAIQAPKMACDPAIVEAVDTVLDGRAIDAAKQSTLRQQVDAAKKTAHPAVGARLDVQWPDDDADAEGAEKKGPILVTGCSGFIGTNYILEKLAAGERVIGMDSFISGMPENLTAQVPGTNYMIFNHPNFRFVNWDVTHPYHIENSDGTKLSRIENTASIASPVFYEEYPEETILANTDGVTNAILESYHHGCCPVHLYSTSEMYGDPESCPQRETDRSRLSTTGRRVPYDLGKAALEGLADAFMKKHGADLQIKVSRTSNTMGIHMNPGDGRVVTTFILMGLLGVPLPIHGLGRQTRSLNPVSNQLKGLKAITEFDTFKDDSGAPTSMPINVGADIQWSILQIGRECLDAVGKLDDREITYKDADSEGAVDAWKAREKQNWETVGADDDAAYGREEGDFKPFVHVGRDPHDPSMRQLDLTRLETLVGEANKVRSEGGEQPLEWRRTTEDEIRTELVKIAGFCKDWLARASKKDIAFVLDKIKYGAPIDVKELQREEDAQAADRQEKKIRATLEGADPAVIRKILESYNGVSLDGKVVTVQVADS